MLSVIYAECHKYALYAGCHFAECRHAECRHAECRYAECCYFSYLFECTITFF
jgi:hypothetical protein